MYVVYIFVVLLGCGAQGLKLHSFRQLRLVQQLAGSVPVIIKPQNRFCLEATSAKTTAVELKNLPVKPYGYVKPVNVYYGVGWVCLCAQMILSSVSGTLFLIAHTVRARQSLPPFHLWVSGFNFSGFGVGLSLMSILWTWNILRVAARFRSDVDCNGIKGQFKRLFRTSIIISLTGLGLALIGIEQIVNSITCKLLQSPGFGQLLIETPTFNPSLGVSSSYQPFEIFLINANVNSLLSHFTALISSISLLAYDTSMVNQSTSIDDAQVLSSS